MRIKPCISIICPTLNEEHSGYAWCNYDCWPKPLHQGVKNSLNNKVVKAKLEVLLDIFKTN